jgi:VIT1/CCC1 family predicted Fe2+/Mn2+ transporter
MMDGLVSNFALIAGVAGADSSGNHHAVTLAGLAGLVGGAFSMATGEYVSVQSQNESARAEIEVERRELRRNSAAEQAELAQMYVQRGVDADLADQVAAQLSRDPDQALDIHVREELGVSPHALPSPWVAAGSSLMSFSVGALIPLLPYALGANALWIAAILSLAALFAAGAVTARFTSRSWLFSATRQVLLGGLAAAVTFGVGQAFGAVTG